MNVITGVHRICCGTIQRSCLLDSVPDRDLGDQIVGVVYISLRSSLDEAKY